MGCFIQCAPLAGLSGCTWILGGDTGSARPATTQALLWKAYRYLLSSHGTKSITIRYSVLGSRPKSRHCRLTKSPLLLFHVVVLQNAFASNSRKSRLDLSLRDLWYTSDLQSHLTRDSLSLIIWNKSVVQLGTLYGLLEIFRSRTSPAPSRSSAQPIYVFYIESADGVWFLGIFTRMNLTWNVGNILRPAFVTIISVPNWWNSSQSGFASKAAPAPISAGWSGLLAANSSTEDAPSLLGWWSPWWRLLLLLSFRGSTVDADEEIGFVTGWTGTAAVLVGLGLSDRFTLPALCKQAEGMTIQRGSTLTLDRKNGNEWSRCSADYFFFHEKIAKTEMLLSLLPRERSLAIDAHFARVARDFVASGIANSKCRNYRERERPTRRVSRGTSSRARPLSSSPRKGLTSSVRRMQWKSSESTMCEPEDQKEAAARNASGSNAPAASTQRINLNG